MIGTILSENDDDDLFDRILVNNGCIVIPEDTKLLSRFKFGIVIELPVDEVVIILDKFVVVSFCSFVLLFLLILLRLVFLDCGVELLLLFKEAFCLMIGEYLESKRF